MRLRNLLFLPLVAYGCMASAAIITRDQAKSRALEFLAKPMAKGMMRAQSRLGESSLKEVISADSAYYIFNVGQRGFVIASASDRTQPVLGYSDNGTFSVSGMPVQLRLWLQRLKEGVHAMENGTVALSKRAQKVSAAPRPTRNAIPALVTSKWNQGSPFNLLCPYYKDEKTGEMTTGDNRSATGCVATAMSQVMYYWRWPQDSTAVIPGYTSKWNMPRTLDPLPRTKFDWGNMLDTYGDGSPEASQIAVAELMEYVGHSISTGYGPASGAYSGNCATALINYFGYNPYLYHASHDNYTYDGWEDLIYSELAKGHPLMMSGDNSDLTGGHEWVCDGYDGNGCFHMNWGWGGMDDGYFVLTVMSPDNQGIGGSTSSDGYSMSQTIVVGVEPNAGQTADEVDVRLSLIAVTTPSKTRFTRKDKSVPFTPVFRFDLATPCQYTHAYDHKFSLYNERGELVADRLCGTNNLTLRPGNRSLNNFAQVQLDNNIANGTYYIRGRSRLHTADGTGEWLDDEGSGDTYLKMVIEGDTVLTLTAIPSPYDLCGDTIILEGDGCKGTEQRVHARVTNRGGREFYGNMFLLEGSQWKSGNCVQVPGNSTMDLYFKYTPTVSGDVRLALSTSKSVANAFYTQTTAIDNVRATTLTVSSRILNPVSNSQIYGNQARVAVSVHNTGDAPFKNNIKLTPWHLVGNMYYFSGGENRFISLEAGGDTILYYTVNNLDYNEQYCFHAQATGVDASNNSATVRIVRGIDYWTADGSRYSVSTTSKPKFGADVAAVYVPGETNVPSISIGDVYNPNIIIYFDENATVGSRTLKVLKKKAKNIVYGTQADEITLTDTAAVFVPSPITAKTAVFSYTVPATGRSEAWGTLVLPFAPTTISDGRGQAADWFHNDSETGKNFRILDFTSAAGQELYFTPAAELKPFHPYVVEWKGAWANGTFDMAGQTITFGGTDVQLEQPEYISTYSKDFKFVGTMAGDTLTDAYALSADGTSFVHAAPMTASPFSAWFVANNDRAALVTALPVNKNDGTASGITDIVGNASEGTGPVAVYSIDGRRVAVVKGKAQLDELPRGIYIVGGRKVICGK